jgi:hypothetical protein
MAAIAVNTLLDESKCYACYDPESVPELSKLALLARISQSSPGTSWVTSFTTGASRNDFTGCAGCALLVGASPVLVSALGCNIVAGGTKIHTIRISDNVCGVILATANLDFTGKSGFNYTSITPTLLAAGTQYFLYLSVVTAQDLWWDAPANPIVVTSVATLQIGAFNLAGPCPNAFAIANKSFGAVDFKYTSP